MTVPINIVSESQLWWNCEEFIRMHSGERGLIPLPEFDRAYDQVILDLKSVATFSEGGLDREANLSSSRDVDPVPSITIVRHGTEPRLSVLSPAVARALEQIERPFCIVFDTDAGYHAVYDDHIETTVSDKAEHDGGANDLSR
jgi:hypothetical protein